MVYLRLEGLKISDALISVILCSCPDIRFLILDKSKGFTNIPIIEIARFSPKLQHLSLNSCICLTNRCITEITCSCSKLRHLELGDCSISNEAIEKIASNCTNLEYLSLKRCRRISNEVLKKLNPKIKIERPDYSDDEFSDSDLPPLIPIFTDETDLISAIVNYLRENPLTKSLFDKLKEDYRIHDPVENLYGDVIGKIKCLDLQFHIKRKWQSLGDTELIDFQIHKNPLFDLVLGQDWLWMREAKISFGHSPKTRVCHAKIVIDGMSIPLFNEDFNKASFTKNNLSKSTESKPGLAQKKVMNIINKILSNIGDRPKRSLLCTNKQRIFCNIPLTHLPSRRLNDDVSKNKSKKNKDKYSMDASSNSDTSDSVSSNSSTSSSEIEVTDAHKTRAVKKRHI
ncbi:4863_t:CDS:2 [Cetraspora pellucida]|uniref:4863_t:CDS:1 n=1 Tax=Cetraspora pellucida TaxID=1433469 RepID=A0A9N9FN83_9GLOM|nr:4863_t:CDS:2 [Cetraspora pellucida]